MPEKTRTLAGERLAALVQTATIAMTAQFTHELQRLRDLAEINDHVRPAEIAATEQQQSDLAAAHLRLGAVRLILRMP